MGKDKKWRLGIFASGTGSNALNLIRQFKGGEVAEVVAVISNNPKAGVLEKAASEGVTTIIVPKAEFSDESTLMKALAPLELDWIILAGFLLKVPGFLIQRFPNRIINLHPALLPKFGGKGMYGRHVHEAVKANGENVSGITIHLVDEEYDKGPIIAQYQVQVRKLDSVDDIERKVRGLEKKHFAPLVEKVLRTAPR